MSRLFGADGIRGVVDAHPLTPEDAEHLGQVVGTWLRDVSSNPTLLIGTDTRESSHRIKSGLAGGLARSGVRVVDGGVLPTAAISYLIASKGCFTAGAVVSASHGPVVENGIKLFDGQGAKLDDGTEQLIEDAFFGSTPLASETRPPIGTRERGYAQEYAEALADEFRDHNWKARRVIMDCANGASYGVGPLVLNGLGLHCVAMNSLPDGTNINRSAGSEYVRVHPERLLAELEKYNADIGFALDGDADRVLFVDRQGRLYDGDMTMAILAYKFHCEKCLSKETVVLTQMSNTGLLRYLQSIGVQTVQVRNGDKYVTKAILADDLVLGGEQVGHVVIHTNQFRITGDGLRTALFVLGELADDSGASLQDLAPGMYKYPQVNASARTNYGPQLKPTDIPGLSALLEKLRAHVPDLTRLECRPASTEPVYRVMLEAKETPLPVLAAWAQKIAKHIQGHLGCLDQPVDILDCVNGGYLSAVSLQESLS